MTKMERQYTMDECIRLVKTWDKMVGKLRKKKYESLTEDEKAVLFIDQESVKIEY